MFKLDNIFYTSGNFWTVDNSCLTLLRGYLATTFWHTIQCYSDSIFPNNVFNCLSNDLISSTSVSDIKIAMFPLVLVPLNQKLELLAKIPKDLLLSHGHLPDSILDSHWIHNTPWFLQKFQWSTDVNKATHGQNYKIEKVCLQTHYHAKGNYLIWAFILHTSCTNVIVI